MRRVRGAAAVIFLLGAGWQAQAQTPASTSLATQESGVPIPQLVALVAKKTGKKFVIDPRVHGDVVLIGQQPSDVSYSDLLTLLRVHGFVGVEEGGYVEVIPDASARQLAMPTVTSKDSRPASEVVTAVISVRSVPAAQLVPILRPLLPQWGHLAAAMCNNTIIVVDTFDNVRRLEGIIRLLDTGETYKAPSCEAAEPRFQTEPATKH
jgi:general secretion pathway protein D